MRRWVIALGALLAVGGGALIGVRMWFVSELHEHRDVLFLGMIGGASDDVDSLWLVLDIALWLGVGLCVVGAAVIVWGLRIARDTEASIAIILATVVVGLVIAIPASMFAIEIGRGRRGSPNMPIATGSSELPKDRIGCADGSRDAFVDVDEFPRIAGCAGAWDGTPSLRAIRTGKPCGDDLPGTCASPADLCARGWHVCASPSELLVVSAAQCALAGEGRFSAAMSSSASQTECAPGLETLPCFSRGRFAEPVCCGEGCLGNAECRDAVWRGATFVHVDEKQACGAMPAVEDGGVVCCPD